MAAAKGCGVDNYQLSTLNYQLVMTLNKVMVIGNLTRDPETRSTPGGVTVCTFGVATNRVWTDPQGQRQEEVEFHNIVAFGKLAEICAQYLGKGRKVYVEGRLKTREWQAQDGAKRIRTEIITENMIMLDRAPGGGGSPGFRQQQPAAPPLAAEAVPVTPVHDFAKDEIKVEEIPFLYRTEERRTKERRMRSVRWFSVPSSSVLRFSLCNYIVSVKPRSPSSGTASSVCTM